MSEFFEEFDFFRVKVNSDFPPCFEQQFKWRCYLAIIIEFVEFQLIWNNVNTKMRSGRSMHNIYGIRHMVSILLVIMMGQDKRIEIGTNVYSLDSQLSFLFCVRFWWLHLSLDCQSSFLCQYFAGLSKLCKNGKGVKKAPTPPPLIILLLIIGMRKV